MNWGATPADQLEYHGGACGIEQQLFVTFTAWSRATKPCCKFGLHSTQLTQLDAHSPYVGPVFFNMHFTTPRDSWHPCFLQYTSHNRKNISCTYPLTANAHLLFRASYSEYIRRRSKQDPDRDTLTPCLLQRVCRLRPYLMATEMEQGPGSDAGR